jgi:hypothetical protein
LSRRLQRYYGRLRRPPGSTPTSRLTTGYRARRSSGRSRSPPGRGGPPQFPPPPSERSAPHTPGGSSGLYLQALHPFHGLRPDDPGSAPPRPRPKAGWLTTRQASLHATDRSVASPNGAFDAGLRPGPLPDRAASLLPGLLAATRTGLTPAGDDELMFGSGHTMAPPPNRWAHVALPTHGDTACRGARPRSTAVCDALRAEALCQPGCRRIRRWRVGGACGRRRRRSTSACGPCGTRTRSAVAERD